VLRGKELWLRQCGTPATLHTPLHRPPYSPRCGRERRLRDSNGTGSFFVALLYASANLGGPPTASALSAPTQSRPRESGGSGSGVAGGGGARGPGERGAEGLSPAAGGGGSATRSRDTALRQLPSAGAPEGDRMLHLHVAVRGIHTGHVTPARIRVSGVCCVFRSVCRVGHSVESVIPPPLAPLLTSSMTLCVCVCVCVCVCACVRACVRAFLMCGAEGGRRRCRRC
jgi:hypothetical protein